MSRSAALTVALLLLLSGAAVGQSNGASRHAGHAVATPAVTTAQRIVTIKLDGHLDERAWQAARPATNFRQQRPFEGQPASQQTEIRILFDDEAIYLGARMFDSMGAAGIRTQLARRDQHVNSDWIEFVLDTYHDHIGRTIP